MAGQQMSSVFDSCSIPSSSVVSFKKYDVFLSFHNEDTRSTFTSHLYAALSRSIVLTFIDDNELKKGDEISPAFIEAIEESRVSIVIFSENYASSKWCLNELKKIQECKNFMEQIVIPVFYKIDPLHMKKQTGSYKKTFEKHMRDLKNDNDKLQKLQKWKDALTEAASLGGWNSQNYRYESDFIMNIVEDVLQKLNLRWQYEIKGLVGVEKNYEQFEPTLEIEQQMGNAFESSSLPSSSVVPLKKYDIFLSFRGEDTRKNITSHLYDALSRNNVETFIDNNKLKKGDKIPQELVNAIEESHASIVIFSENYASSKWCLNELKKILECKKYKEQIVIPVFYKIDPSDVRNQTGSYEQAFAKHKRDLKHKNDRLHKWKEALAEAANLVGWTWDSQNDRTESDFVKEIVKDVLQKLNFRPQYEIKGLVGIENSYKQIESILNIESNEVRVLGIWGMGGIGKTTLAEALSNKLYSKFEGRCFLNGMDESNKYGRCFSTLLKEAPSSVTQIARKKVFIVFDGVETLEQIEDLIPKIDGLGPGSRVIITTRDKRIFSKVSKCEIYEVKELNKHGSLQLFSLTAFGDKYPKFGYEDLLESVITYCQGNPLALKVLGANLSSRGKEEWENELKKLQKIPNMKIHNVLKLSYDGLDCCQKAIFLDIACFLRGESKDFVTDLLEACEFFAISGIEVLLDKSLIQLKLIWHAKSEVDGIEMQDLLQEMGREIVNQESKDPGKRSRLWKAEEISDVLKKNKGTEDVEGITFDCTEVGNLYLKSDSFRSMTNLRYLKIYNVSLGSTCNVYFPNGLEWLSDKLRFLRWDGYCLESLPPTFCAEMLIELHMTHSKLKKLWDGIQNLVNLNILWLESSKDLIEIPDLSRATNLRKVYLFECESLCQLHPSIFSLPRLTYLCLGNCKKIESLKTNIHSKSLCVLLLDGCSSLMEFSVTSEEMTQLTLRGTAIRKLSSSIWRNCKLTSLDLTECNKLNIVEKKLSDDHGLGSVTELDLSGCTEIDASSLWSILDGIQSLKRLKLTECCNLESLPENIQNHSMLKWLDLDDCRKLASLTELPPSLLYLKAVNCTYLDADSTQRSLLENMVQTFSKDPPYEEDDDFSFLPGAQVPCKFDFQTIESSITISPIPKFGLRGFIFCIILSEGFHVYHHSLHCIIFEHGKEVDRFRIVHEYTGTLISDHLLICWHGYNILESGSNDCNLSFQFILQGPNEELRWSTEGIKGCGVLPVYNLERGLDLDGGEIGKLKFSAEYPEGFDWPWENHNDELQPRAFEGEVRSSNNENEDDQKHSCCSIGLFLRHLLRGSRE